MWNRVSGLARSTYSMQYMAIRYRSSSPVRAFMADLTQLLPYMRNVLAHTITQHPRWHTAAENLMNSTTYTCPGFLLTGIAGRSMHLKLASFGSEHVEKSASYGTPASTCSSSPGQPCPGVPRWCPAKPRFGACLRQSGMHVEGTQVSGFVFVSVGSMPCTRLDT